MKRTIQYLSFIVYAFVCVLILAPQQVRADEVNVTGNGADSSSNVSASSNVQANVQQSNNAQITNNVSTNSSTGNNTATGNTGSSTTIATGNTGANTTVENNANSSTVSQPCCSTSTGASATIAGNGSDSQNNASFASESQTSVTIDQTATIHNTIKETANTGGNSARNNSGNVSIHTGNIVVHNTIATGPINSASVSVPQGSTDTTSVKIAGNGVGSDNTASAIVDTSTHVTVTDRSNIANDVESSFTTGGNSANNNFGTVDIATGDIISETRIVNGPINVTGAEVVCCNQLVQIPPTQSPSSPSLPSTNANQPATTPSTTSVSAGSSSSSSPSSSGSVLGAVTSNLLPVTGNNWFFFAMLANVVMLFLGSYLRLHSGNSPNFAYSFH